MSSLPRTLRRGVSRVVRRYRPAKPHALLRMLPRGSVGAEIGVWKGDFSAILLSTLRPQRLHLIDPWLVQSNETYQDAWYGNALPGGQAAMDAMHQGVRIRFRRAIKHGRVVVHRCASTEIASTFPDSSFDWVYIDGDHTYEAVRADLAAYSPKVKPGGIICGDDYHRRGWWGDAVIRAVNDFANEVGAELVELPNDKFALHLIL